MRRKYLRNAAKSGKKARVKEKRTHTHTRGEENTRKCEKVCSLGKGEEAKS